MSFILDHLPAPVREKAPKRARLAIACAVCISFGASLYSESAEARGLRFGDALGIGVGLGVLGLIAGGMRGGPRRAHAASRHHAAPVARRHETKSTKHATRGKQRDPVATQDTAAKTPPATEGQSAPSVTTGRPLSPPPAVLAPANPAPPPVAQTAAPVAPPPVAQASAPAAPAGPGAVDLH